MKDHSEFSLLSVDLWKSPLSFWPWAKRLNREIAEQVPAGALLLGYSLGGRLALHALLSAPNLWRAAVLIGTHPGLSNLELPMRASADENWHEQLTHLPWPEFWEKWNHQPIFGDCHRARPDWHPNMVHGLTTWSLAEQDNLWPRLGEIRCPVLWVAGEHDQKFRTLAESAVRIAPNSRQYVAPNCYHRVPWEDPGFVDSIRCFYKEALGTNAPNEAI